jgi:DNA processing protein
VVGSRNATSYGLSTARRLASELAESGFTVVSGMARGIDAAAHAGALDAGGRTVAVLGSGLENPYPPENIALSRRIAVDGALLSEFPLRAEPVAHHFPIRNRVISGLTLGTLVVEATRSSGSLITARLAAEQNREVFAVPGSVTSFKSMGTHGLIRQGAKLVACAREIIEELPPLDDGAVRSEKQRVPQTVPPCPQLPNEEASVFRAMTPYAQHIDELVRQLAIDPGPLSAILLRLEIRGLISRAPGNFFTLTPLS